MDAGEVIPPVILPASQYAHKCLECGHSWARSVSGDRAVRLTGHQEFGFVSLEADPDGLYVCCTRRFKWAEKDDA